jgi:hypothetical protein
VCCFSVLFVVYTCTSIFICGTSCLRCEGYFKTGTSIPLQPTRRVFHSTAIQPSNRVRISSFKVIFIIRLFTPSRRHPDPVPRHRELSSTQTPLLFMWWISCFLIFLYLELQIIKTTWINQKLICGNERQVWIEPTIATVGIDCSTPTWPVSIDQ